MRWSMLPVSIAGHGAILVALLINAASGATLPTPWPPGGVRDYVAARAVPPARPVAPSSAKPPLVASGVPIGPPDGIVPQPVAVPDGIPIDGGLSIEGVGMTVGAPDGSSIAVPVPELPAPPSVPRDPVRPGGKIRPPRKLHEVAPVFPEIARRARVEGYVILEATIDERGSVVDVRVLRSIPLLDEAALAAVRQWRYTPTLLNGVPVRVLMTITFNFRLNDGQV